MDTKETKRTVKGNDYAIKQIIKENEHRNDVINAIFNPITGENSILDRTEVFIEDFPI